MIVTVFSVIMSIVCSSVIFLSVCILISYFKKMRRGLILLMLLLGLVRLCVPLSFAESIVLRSWRLYPFLQQFAQTEIVFKATPMHLLALIWICGSVVMFWLLRNKLRQLREIVERSVPLTERDDEWKLYEKAAAQLGYHGTVRIAVTNEFSTAVSVGLRSPLILLPVEMLRYSDWELLGVLKHELTHHLRKDTWKKLLLSLAQCVFWWNPVIHYLTRCFVEMLELECDERSCQGMSDEERLAYLEAIKKTIQNGRTRDLELGLGYGRNHSAEFLERRFREVLNPVRRYSKRMTGMVAALCVMTFVASYAVILQPAYLPTVADDVAEETQKTQGAERDFLVEFPDGTYLYVHNLVEKAYLTDEERKESPYCDLPIYNYKRGD